MWKPQLQTLPPLDFALFLGLSALNVGWKFGCVHRQMAQFFAFGFQVFRVVRIGPDFDRNLLDDFHP